MKDWLEIAEKFVKSWTLGMERDFRNLRFSLFATDNMDGIVAHC